MKVNAQLNTTFIHIILIKIKWQKLVVKYIYFKKCVTSTFNKNTSFDSVSARTSFSGTTRMSIVSYKL